MNKKKVFRAVCDYLIFFTVVAFVVSCCMILFITTMADHIDIEFTNENVGTAALLTMLNVLLLTFLLTTCDQIRRKLTIDRPVKIIQDGLDKIKSGDFSARISVADKTLRFNEIAESINLLAAELSGVETLRTDFISNVSHELKTPLAVMQNYGTLLQANKLSDEKRVEYAKGITDSSRKLAALISNILKLNKLENQQIFPSSEPFNISEQLCACLLDFENVWEEKNIDIETDIEDEVIINADSELLSPVWNNLLSNAFKFTESGGTVSISLTSEENSVSVRISDTGCGIPTDTRSHIFEKFYQGDTSHAAQGNGLGLALVKRIIDITGGDISVESEVGKGSTFTVVLKKDTSE